jgi:hypothetical protein
MQQLDQTKLNDDVAIIQLLHSRLGLDLSSSMAYGTGNFWYLRHLNNKNILITDYLDILRKHDILGDDEITDQYNVLTISDINSIIDDCYRELERYNI